MNVNDAIPWIVGGIGLIVAAKFITDQTNSSPPPSESDAATTDFPSFPEFGSEIPAPEMVPALEWPHPYGHPRIPRYPKSPAYFQNSAPIYDPEYFKDNLWYGQVENYPPLHVTVSQNLPTAETYSHHHFYFDQRPETKPIDSGIFKNIV